MFAMESAGQSYFERNNLSARLLRRLAPPAAMVHGELPLPISIPQPSVSIPILPEHEFLPKT